MQKITILHVFPDEKFFDGVSDFFDSLDNVDNIYALYTKEEHYQYKYIKKTNKIRLYTKYRKYVSLFHSSSIDIIYFHSLSPFYYRFFKYISKDKKIIWWCWGYDVYGGFCRTKPFIPINLYKPITENYKKQLNLNFSIKDVFKFLLRPYFSYQKAKVIKRINYFSPVIPIEYDLMKLCCKNFRAKPFMLNSGPGFVNSLDVSFRNKCGNILVNNSITWENNLLDVCEALYHVNLNIDRKYIIPCSYGIGYGGVDNLKEIVRLNPLQVIWLDSYMPKKEYFEMYDNISHAVFGTIRQQAMGTIFYCLRNGIKVYLFENSYVYKALIKEGYYVYNIENQLNEISLNLPLSKEEAKHNNDIYVQRYKHKLQNTSSEIYNIVNS